MGGKTKMEMNTPLSHMMELRNWQRQKINNTIVLEDECPGNVLSEELLKILDIQETQKKKELCSQLAQNTTILIDKVIRDLATKQGFNQSQEEYERCLK